MSTIKTTASPSRSKLMRSAQCKAEGHAASAADREDCERSHRRHRRYRRAGMVGSYGKMLG